MTQTVEFGRLETVPLRTAWALEATAFTPWLAENLDRLGEALGIPLEHVQTEAPVTTYSADILARNADDGSNVLIENQLEESDHGHLGQIMTYLAGLSAKTVVWVAPRFREAHLSAVKWLNENTAEPFSFFAVEVRVVRIGDSPLAPVFDVVERPNAWERAQQERVRESRPRARGRMKIRTSYSPLALFTCQRDDASPFLVFKSKFAVRSQRIPCYVAQGIYRQLSDISYYSLIGVISEGPKATKFPVLFLLAGNLDLADGFGRTTSTARNL